ncbi:group II intron reverse transcriptase/maturase [Bacillus piscicola]|uniref:group II intron reverse transcriptase/maturase n=1 Tax=Bacillus piscicola TaxID=1632684 RepID=UPI001F099215|nr:group II intron reverse transcriptase/maturase [Bacillus piscicola]
MRVNQRKVTNEMELQGVLDSMYATSRNESKPFFGLVELMTNREVIITAIHNIKSNKGSKTAGIDNKVMDDFLHMDMEKVINCVRSVVGNYNPLPVRRVYIKKKSGKKRPLGIPAIIDRIIQEMARIVLEPIAEAKFYDYSYGFRPYRSAEHATAEILERIRRSKTYWVIEGDIKSFFDNINHNKLIEILWGMGIKDKRFLMLIKKMLRAGVMEDNTVTPNETGSPQGGIISPLLANIYLNNFDWMIAHMFQKHPARQAVKDPLRQGLSYVRRRHLRCHLVRYADDWIILCETKEQAQRILTKIDKYLWHVLGIELSKEKTKITNILENKITFLGLKIFAQSDYRNKQKYFGKAIPDMKSLNNKVREVLKDVRWIGRHQPIKEDDFIRWAAVKTERANAKIVGLAEYYKITTCSHIYKSLDQRIYNQAWHTWRKIYGKKKYWEDLTIPSNQLSNRTDRHKRRKDRLFAIEIDNIHVGLTKFQFTKSVRAMKFNEKMTPFSKEGRKLFEKRSGKKLPLQRGTYYTVMELWYSYDAYKKYRNPLRNFEFLMNREYALLRDKGRCKCCDDDIRKGILHCHHIKPYLPLDKVNKVSNLATVCRKCHLLIHSKKEIFDSKRKDKIMKYRERLMRRTVKK